MEELLNTLKPFPQLTFGNATLPLETDEPESYYVEKAKQELQETPEYVQESLAALREMF